MFPGRPGGVRDEPLLDMLLERRPIPPGAPPGMHDLARILDAAAGPAESGELAGEAAALAAFTRQASPAGISSAAQRRTRRPARHRLSRWPVRGRFPMAASLAVAAAGLGSIAVAYFLGVLPGSNQQPAPGTAGGPVASASPSQHSHGLTLQSGAHQDHATAAPRPAPSATRSRPHAGSSTLHPHLATPGATPAAACTPRSGRPWPYPNPAPTGIGYPGWGSPSPTSGLCLGGVTPAPSPQPDR